MTTKPPKEKSEQERGSHGQAHDRQAPAKRVPEAVFTPAEPSERPQKRQRTAIDNATLIIEKRSGDPELM
jgi:hypothetical protein